MAAGPRRDRLRVVRFARKCCGRSLSGNSCAQDGYRLEKGFGAATRPPHAKAQMSCELRSLRCLHLQAQLRPRWRTPQDRKRTHATKASHRKQSPSGPRGAHMQQRASPTSGARKLYMHTAKGEKNANRLRNYDGYVEARRRPQRKRPTMHNGHKVGSSNIPSQTRPPKHAREYGMPPHGGCVN